MLMISHYAEKRLTDVGEIVIITRKLRSTVQTNFSFFWNSFVLQVEQTRGHRDAGSNM
jgi:hypothetical protein